METQQGKPLVLCNGFLMAKHMPSSDGTHQFWRCQMRHKGCHGRAISAFGSTTLKETTPHNGHVASPAEVKKRQGITKVKRMAVASYGMPSSSILDAAKSEFLEEEIQAFPKDAKIKRMITNARKAIRKMPSNSDFLSLSPETSREAAAKQSAQALIKSVHSRPMLWDKADKNYKHVARKKTVWELVANEAGFKDGPAAMAKWGYLRGEYGKQKKKLPSASGSDDVTWPFFTSMQFLDRTSEERLSDAPDTAVNPFNVNFPMQEPFSMPPSTSETTVRINKRKLEPESDNGLDPEFDNETIETQIKREKLENLKLSNCNLRLSKRLLELQIIEKERELGVSRRTEKGIQCDEWTTLIGQILR